MGNFHLTLRYKRLLLALGAVTLLLVAWQGNGVVRWMEQADVRSARIVARNSKFNLEQKFEDGQRVIELLRVIQPFLSLESPSGCQQVLSALEARFSQYQNFAFLDTDGIAICSDIPQPLPRPVQMFLRPNLPVNANGVPGRGVKRHVLRPSSKDVLEGISEKSGQVIVVASNHWFTRAIDISPLPTGTVWFITDDSGQAVRRSADRRHELPSLAEMQVLLPNEAHGAELTTGDGVVRYYVGVPLSFGEETYHLFVGVPAEMLRAGPAQVGRQIQFALVLIAVIFIAMALLIIHH